MQPLPFFFIQQASRESADSGSTLLLPVCQLNFYKPDFRKSGKPRIALRIYCAKITARRNRFDIVPNEVRWKNLLRHLKNPATCRKPPNSLPAFHMLELAKGFEPPTP
jgi:hypothetical protein